MLDGKYVLGLHSDIRKVQNVYEAYEIISKLNMY